jgi:hypothetical protein
MIVFAVPGSSLAFDSNPRAAKLVDEERGASARKAALARWSRKKALAEEKKAFGSLAPVDIVVNTVRGATAEKLLSKVK